MVFDHSSYAFMPQFRRELMPEFNTSRYGVMLFFLVSGYIIPASLERRGSVRAFWIGRVFRIHPLLAAVLAALLAAHQSGLAQVRDFGDRSAVSVAIAHLTLLQELLATPNLLLVLWTLSYEMAFYLLAVGLFTVRQHRRSAVVAVGLAVLAAVSVAVGFTPPALSGAVGADRLIVWAAAVLAVAVCCASARRAVVRVSGGMLGGALALVLVVFNGTVAVWEGLVILAVMFLGTAVHRAEHGRSTWRRAALTAVVVVACAVGSAYGAGDGAQFTRRGWITAFLLAVVTFAAALALRERRFPRPLLRLGTVSYSVYLLHPLLLAVNDAIVGDRRQDSLLHEAAFLAVLLPLSALTHRHLEAPAHRWGRELAHRAESPP